jgi:hypothetical protein
MVGMAPIDYSVARTVLGSPVGIALVNHVWNFRSSVLAKVEEGKAICLRAVSISK